MDPVFGALGFSFIKLMYAIYFSPPPFLPFGNCTQLHSDQIPVRQLQEA